VPIIWFYEHHTDIPRRYTLCDICLILPRACKSLPHTVLLEYRVIHKALRDFRPLRYSSRDGHAEGEHVNRGRDTPSFCPTLQVLDMSTLGDAVDVNPLIKFLPHTLQYLADDSSDCLHDNFVAAVVNHVA
jgi:hypothetical protein